MMGNLDRRVSALEGSGRYVTLGEMLDHLAGEPLPSGRALDPAIVSALDALPGR